MVGRVCARVVKVLVLVELVVDGVLFGRETDVVVKFVLNDTRVVLAETVVGSDVVFGDVFGVS